MKHEAFEEYLKQAVNEGLPSRTRQAMEYSLMAGGKRIRPALLAEALKAYGLEEEIGYPVGAAIEMIHTYSLIHDDLPAMDNDDLRRGKPTCHKAFDEAAAILAGDALLTQAFSQALKADVRADQKTSMIQALSEYAGANGMVYGQDLDINASSHKQDIDLLKKIDLYKTGKLLQLPLVCAAIIADHPEDIEKWNSIGEDLGIEFQFQDDILDVLGSPEVLGKNSSDVRNEKLTAVSCLGLQEAQKQVEACDAHLRSVLKSMNLQDEDLTALLNQILQRKT